MVKSKVATGAIILTLFAARAGATSITFQGEGKGAIVDIQSPSLGHLSSVNAGELLWSFVGPPPVGLNASFYSYCVDANNWTVNTENVIVGPSSTLTTPGVSDAGGKAAWLIQTYAVPIRLTGSGIQAAALQVAVWTALYNQNPDFTSGPFRLYTTGAIATQAQTYLSALYSAPQGYYTSTTTWLDAPTGRGQDQMVPNPEPATLVLLGTGLVGVVARCRRRTTFFSVRMR